MSERKFTLDDQFIFAKLSGDYNKSHIDEVAARRYLFGEPVVHGIHLLLWALDQWLASIETSVELISLETSFQDAVYIGESVHCKISYDESKHIRIELFREDRLCTLITGEWKAAKTKNCESVNSKFPERKDPRVLTPKEVLNAGGELDLCVEKETANNLFPRLVEHLPLLQIAQILATTRLVGMECPGFHSVFDKLSARFQNSISKASSIKYQVAKFDDRFSLTFMDVMGPSMTGKIRAFLRPPPREALHFSDARNQIITDEFKGQKALIIGGSRGLGEVTAKLLAAGGAEVLLTYHKGLEDAQRVSDEINSGGARAHIMPFNVLTPEGNENDSVKVFTPTHLYYFATPHIKDGKKIFSDKLFRYFYDYYVSGFANTLEFFLTRTPTLKKVFYPSSVFVENTGSHFAEYAKAKAEGEARCRELEKSHKEIAFYSPRLPKLATDQTVNLIPDSSGEPGPIILEHLRTFRNYSR